MTKIIDLNTDDQPTKKNTKEVKQPTNNAYSNSSMSDCDDINENNHQIESPYS
jgi:hypothetical protein